MTAQPRSSKHLKGIAITATGVLILSPDGLLTSLVEADPRTSLIWRGLFMGLALSVFILLRYRAGAGAAFGNLRRMPYLAVGVLFAISSIGWVTAIVTTSVANTLFIVACAPLFSAIFAWVFLGERVPPRTIITILIAIAAMGVIFAEGLGRGDLVGNLAAVMTALAWAGLVVILGHARIEDPAPSLALGAFLVAIVAFAAAPAVAVAGNDWLWLAILGFVVLPASFFLIGLGPRYIPAPEVSLIMLLEAVLGPLWAWLVITQSPSPTTLVGGAVILGTLAVHFAIGLRQQTRG